MSNREYESRETNQNRIEDTSSRFFLGAIIGGVVGAAAALLLAPKSGKELRNTLNNQAGSILEKSIQLRENAMNKSNEWVSKTSSLSQGFVQQSSELLNKVKGKKDEEIVTESEINYISIPNPIEKIKPKTSLDIGNLDSSDLKRKLDEAKKAFDEEEKRIKI